MNPHLVIARNFPSSDEFSDRSFLGRLHEELFWNWDEYWLLEWALHQLCNEPPARELHWRVFRIFSHLFLSCGCHFDPNDGFKIANLADDEVVDCRERVQLVFEGFFKGELPPQEIFPLFNPMLSGT